MDDHDDLPEQHRSDLRAGDLRAGPLRGQPRVDPQMDPQIEPRLDLRSEPREEFRADYGYNPRAGYSQQAQGDYYPPQDGYEDDAYSEPPPRKRAVTGLAVVALALGAFGGIIYYAYTQGMRAGTESVAPVLRADTSPTRMRPEQPGGMDVPHQDKLVYDRLNPGNAGQPEVERLLPPPEAPLDRPRAEETPAMDEEGPPVVLGQEDGPIPGGVPAQPEAPVATGRPLALSPQATAPAPAPRTAAPAATPAKPQPTSPEVAVAKPVPAPPAVTTPKAEPAKAPTSPPPAATGAVRVQVGAVDAESKATAEWSRLQRKFPADLGSLGMRTVRADLGAKGVFYRIQAGPVDESRAKQICSSLKAQNVGCILVR